VLKHEDLFDKLVAWLQGQYGPDEAFSSTEAHARATRDFPALGQTLSSLDVAQFTELLEGLADRNVLSSTTGADGNKIYGVSGVKKRRKGSKGSLQDAFNVIKEATKERPVEIKQIGQRVFSAQTVSTAVDILAACGIVRITDGKVQWRSDQEAAARKVH
jgi:hypothetical protein